jgi:hypothetical protein
MMPMEAVMDPHSFMRLATVPRDFLFPQTDGCDVRSAATAEVMMFLSLQERIGKKRWASYIVLT